jgi:hypothetical protein
LIQFLYLSRHQSQRDNAHPNSICVRRFDVLFPRAKTNKQTRPTRGDLVATVARKRPGQRTGLQHLTEMGISVGDGTIVPLTDEDCINELDSEAKSYALDQAMILYVYTSTGR